MKRGPEARTVVAGRRLHEDLVEDPLSRQSPVGDAVQRNTAGHHKARAPGPLPQTAREIEHDLLGPVLQCECDITVVIEDRAVDGARGAEASNEPRGH
jgi:hypothetical protein